MEGLAKQIFEQLTDANNAASEHMQIGRAQFARDVQCWINRVGLHRFGDIPVGELVAMCREQTKP